MPGYRFLTTGKGVASLGISGPVNRIRLDKVEEYTSSMKDIALQISKKLGLKEKQQIVRLDDNLDKLGILEKYLH